MNVQPSADAQNCLHEKGVSCLCCEDVILLKEHAQTNKPKQHGSHRACHSAAQGHPRQCAGACCQVYLSAPSTLFCPGPDGLAQGKVWYKDNRVL